MADAGDSQEPDVTAWIRLMESGDEDAISHLFHHCYPRLLRYARTRLPERLRRALDEEDIALSAFKSFCSGAQQRKLGEITDRESLWRLLNCIAARKSSGVVRGERRQKRGSGVVRGESVFSQTQNQRGSLDEIGGNTSLPLGIEEYQQACREMLDLLEDEELQALALLRLEGYSVDDISERLGCAKRTVERRLSIIRRIWSDELGDESS